MGTMRLRRMGVGRGWEHVAVRRSCIDDSAVADSAISLSGTPARVGMSLTLKKATDAVVVVRYLSSRVEQAPAGSLPFVVVWHF